MNREAETSKPSRRNRIIAEAETSKANRESQIAKTETSKPDRRNEIAKAGPPRPNRRNQKAEAKSSNPNRQRQSTKAKSSRPNRRSRVVNTTAPKPKPKRGTKLKERQSHGAPEPGEHAKGRPTPRTKTKGTSKAGNHQKPKGIKAKKRRSERPAKPVHTQNQETRGADAEAKRRRSTRDAQHRIINRVASGTSVGGTPPQEPRTNTSKDETPQARRVREQQ